MCCLISIALCWAPPRNPGLVSWPNSMRWAIDVRYLGLAAARQPFPAVDDPGLRAGRAARRPGLEVVLIVLAVLIDLGAYGGGARAGSGAERTSRLQGCPPGREQWKSIASSSSFLSSYGTPACTTRPAPRPRRGAVGGGLCPNGLWPAVGAAALLDLAGDPPRLFEAYRRALPAVTYDGIKPWIDRVIAGEVDALLPEPPVAWP